MDSLVENIELEFSDVDATHTTSSSTDHDAPVWNTSHTTSSSTDHDAPVWNTSHTMSSSTDHDAPVWNTSHTMSLSTDHDAPVWNTSQRSQSLRNVAAPMTSRSRNPGTINGLQAKATSKQTDHVMVLSQNSAAATTTAATGGGDKTGMSDTLRAFLDYADADLHEKTLQYLDDPEMYFSHLEQEDTVKVALSCGLFILVIIVTIIVMFTLNPPM